MTDILIRGMEKPCSCLTCRIAGARGGEYYCNLQTEEQNQSATTLMELYDGCPIVEVKTPHGRLIDAEAFVDYMQNRYDNNEITNGDWIDFRLSLKDQPTIIEAEGGEAVDSKL